MNENVEQTVTLRLTDELIEKLSSGERPVEEQIYRAVRLYVMMDNADEVLAESELRSTHDA